jgi:Cu(I)/Ag(I) efflux system membrane fusion protein
VLHAYLRVGDSLAADDAAGAKSAFAALAQASTGTLDALGARLVPIAQAGASKSDLADQRKHFDPASEAVIELVQAHGNALSEPLRLMRCPMAFENRGARWLQHGEALRNPYFGASMLRCGSVVSTFAADAPAAPAVQL